MKKWRDGCIYVLVSGVVWTWWWIAIVYDMQQDVVAHALDHVVAVSSSNVLALLWLIWVINDFILPKK